MAAQVEKYTMVMQMRMLAALPGSLFASLLLLAAACATAPEATPPPAEPPPQEAERGAEQFVVTQEVYSRTFEEVERFVASLNEIIRRADFATWVTYLSAEYVSRTSDPQYLQQQSEQPRLRQNHVQLRSLRDYFDQVVVPSRVQASVDEIEFIDESRVKAITTFRNTRAVLYLLVRENGNWKIGVW